MSRKFLRDPAIEQEGDDSTDEEEQILDLFNILDILEHSWEKFQKEKLPELLRMFQPFLPTPTSSLHEQYFRSSFILHFLGRALLNDQRIKNRYRYLKRQTMPKNRLKKYPDLITVRNIVRNSIISLSSDFEDERLINQESGLLCKNLINFITSNEKLITEIANDLFSKKRLFLKIINRPEFLLKISSFQQLIKSLLTTDSLEIKTFKSRKKFTLSKMKALGQKDTIHLDDCLFLIILEEINSLNSSEEDSELKSVLISLNNKIEDQEEDQILSNFEQELKNILDKMEESSSLEDLTIAYFVEDNQVRLIEAKKKDLLAQEKSEPGEETILWKILHHKSVPPSMTKKIMNEMSLNSQHIKAHLIYKIKAGHIQKNIATEIAKHILLDRDVLPIQHIFINQDRLALLTNILLVNRSQHRLVRNKKSSDNGQGDIRSIYWQSGGRSVDERCEIVPPSFSRRQEVDPLTGASSKTKIGRYRKIYENLEEFKKFVPSFDDSQIARCIQLISSGACMSLEGPKGELYSQFFSTLTLLLTGTESIRSPASLLLQPIAFDLIASGKMTWQEALAKTRKIEIDGKRTDKPIRYEGGCIPMTMRSGEIEVKGKKNSSPGAVASARWLHLQYNPYMPVDYMYEGDEQNENQKGLKHILELIKREHELLLHWFTDNSTNKLSKISVKEIGEHILSPLFHRWYPELISNLHVYKPNFTSMPTRIFEEHAMPLDGNCLFHALMQGIIHLRSQNDWKEDKATKDIHNHFNFCQIIVDFIEIKLADDTQKNEMMRRIMNVAAMDQFRQYVGDIIDRKNLFYDEQGNLDMTSSGINTTVEKYIHLMSQEGTYGGDLEIIMACELFKISVACYRYNSEENFEEIIIGDPTHPRVSLLYKSNLSHYELLLPYKGQSALIIQDEHKNPKIHSDLFRKSSEKISEILKKDFTNGSKPADIINTLATAMSTDNKTLEKTITEKLESPENLLIIHSILHQDKQKSSMFLSSKDTIFKKLRGDDPLKLVQYFKAESICSDNQEEIAIYIKSLKMKIIQLSPKLNQQDIEIISRILNVQIVVHFVKDGILRKLNYNCSNISNLSTSTKPRKIDLYLNKANYSYLTPKESHVITRSYFRI